ncbi:MAG: hypothetical protein NVS4B12_28610 [Ktedonobacteraceae bacterium]
MIEETQESALVAVLEQVLHHHFTQALQGLLPVAINPHRFKHVLDIDCRIGAWAVDLALSYPNVNVTGLDNSTAFINIARRNAEVGGLSRARFYETESLLSLPLADATFDFVHTSQLSPVFRPDQWPLFLKECKRVMKTGAAINIVSLSLGPSSSEAYQRLLLLIDALLYKLGYSFSEWPATTSQGVYLFHLLKEAGFANCTYAIHPINFGGMNNSPGRACCQVLLNSVKKLKPLFLEYDVVGNDELDLLLLQKQRDINEATFCAAGALISATAYVPLT